MGKKNRLVKPPKGSAQTTKAREGDFPDEPISSLGWRVIAGGVVLVVAGFALLTQADPMGRNWASTASPLLILAGYAVVGLGVFIPAAPKGGENPPSSPPPDRP